MNNTDALDDYVLEHITRDWENMLNQMREEYRQSKAGSMVEAHINALVGAPPAIAANFLLLAAFYPENATVDFVAMWAILTWPIFFYLSVGRIWLIRRIFERWGILLEPRYIYNWLKARFNR